MIEVSMVFDCHGFALFWPSSEGNKHNYIEDSSILWNRIWDNRNRIEGIAHTHPWSCPPFPSATDETTWWAIEKALGKRLTWPIISMNSVGFFRSFPCETGHFYQATNFKPKYTTHWMENVIELRRLSSV